MAIDKKRRAKEYTTSLSLRRSDRHHHQILAPGSSLEPIIIPDSSPLRPKDNEKHGSTTTVNKESELIQIIPEDAVDSDKRPAQIRGIDANKELIQLIQAKQSKLLRPESQSHGLDEFIRKEEDGYEGLQGAVDATLVFAQEEAGTALCISPTGLLLTCAHCVAEFPSDLDFSKTWLLLFSSGRIVQAKIVKWDEKRDLALLRIVGAQVFPSRGQPSAALARRPGISLSKEPPEYFQFPSIMLATSAPKIGVRMLCIGHPGSEDLESSVAGIATGYDVLHVSQGKFRGYAKGQDKQDNSEIGALKHDCWTYWGHSGAPLVLMGVERRGGRLDGRETGSDDRKGKLVGLHSSWDEETGMRRGVGWEALNGFLREAEETGLI